MSVVVGSTDNPLVKAGLEVLTQKDRAQTRNSLRRGVQQKQYWHLDIASTYSYFPNSRLSRDKNTEIKVSTNVILPLQE